jgi:hypothetical protein
MTPIYAAYFILALAIAGALVMPGRTLRTALAVMALCGGVALVATAIGRAKPLWTERLCDTSIATVLGSQLREDEGTIFLWLQPEGCEPTAYRMAWSKELAEQIQKAMDEMERQGTESRLMFEHSYDQKEPKVYPLPQAAMPLKTAPPPPVFVPEQSA